MTSLLLCKVTEICNEGFLLSRNLQGARAEEDIHSSNDSGGKMLENRCVHGAWEEMKDSSWRVRVAGRTRWGGRSSESWPHLTWTFMKELTEQRL